MNKKMQSGSEVGKGESFLAVEAQADVGIRAAHPLGTECILSLAGKCVSGPHYVEQWLCRSITSR